MLTKTIVAALTAAGGGNILQVVWTADGVGNTGPNIIPVDNSSPLKTEGDEYMTRTITPSNANNLLIVIALGIFAHNTANAWRIMALFQDDITNALKTSAASEDSGDHIYPLTIIHPMIAGTTDEIDFKIRAGGSVAGTLTFNGNAGTQKFGGSSTSILLAIEVEV